MRINAKQWLTQQARDLAYEQGHDDCDDNADPVSAPVHGAAARGYTGQLAVDYCDGWANARAGVR